MLRDGSFEAMCQAFVKSRSSITQESFLVQCCVALGHNPLWLSISILQQLGCGIYVKLGLVVSHTEAAMELKGRGEVNASLVLWPFYSTTP